MDTKPSHSPRQGSVNLQELWASPEAVDLFGRAFARAYQAWRGDLADGAVDGMPVASGTSDSLFRMVLQEILKNTR